MIAHERSSRFMGRDARLEQMARHKSRGGKQCLMGHQPLFPVPRLAWQREPSIAWHQAVSRSQHPTQFYPGRDSKRANSGAEGYMPDQHRSGKPEKGAHLFMDLPIGGKQVSLRA